MTLFRKQPGFCGVCGTAGDYDYGSRPAGPVLCGAVCRKEAGWRYTLYALGKGYYPQPDTPPQTGDEK